MFHQPTSQIRLIGFTACILGCQLAAAQATATADSGPLTARERAMLQRIENLEKRLAIVAPQRGIAGQAPLLDICTLL